MRVKRLTIISTIRRNPIKMLHSASRKTLSVLAQIDVYKRQIFNAIIIPILIPLALTAERMAVSGLCSPIMFRGAN